MVNQQDIADELGISRTLVSKVLRNKLGTTRARSETIDAIWQTAKRLGYQPNSTAVSLATGRQGAIGVCIRRFGNLASRLAEDIADGVIDAAAAAGQKLMMTYYTNNDTDHAAASIEPLLSSGALDGLLMAGFMPADLPEPLKYFKKLPMVFVRSESIMRDDCSHIMTNDARMSAIATTHLIEQGCQKIACVSDMSYRLTGFLDTMKQRSLDIDWRLVVDMNELLPAQVYSYEAGQLAVEKLLARKIDFDGVVAASDEQALAILNKLIKLGRRVPEDVKIIGIDNSPQCEFSICPLSSVDQNLRKAGFDGFNMLMQQIKDPTTAIQFKTIDPILVQRQSSK